MPIPKSIVFTLVVSMFMLTIELTWSRHGLSNLQCPENERQALLSFKHGVKGPSNRLSSWEGHDCCNWHGVDCDNSTGHVAMLDLHNPFPFDFARACYNGDGLSDQLYEESILYVAKVSPSLVQLKHLKYLDLSWNHFSGSSIPKFFGSFQKLEYLNLSSAWFSGYVPHHLRNLSSLLSLDLTVDDPHAIGFPELMLNTFDWASNLFHLQHLAVSGVHLADIHVDPFQISTWFPSLVELRLSSCGLPSSFADAIGNMTSLEVLDLGFNNFSSPFPDGIRNMTSLKFLNMAYTFVSGGLILDELNSLKNLKTLDLSGNLFKGKLTLDNLSFAESLETLNMHDNDFNGVLPDMFYQLKNLKRLHLSENSFQGPLPSSLGSLSALESLYLNMNHFSGPIPTSLGNLSNLKYLNLMGNKLIGQIPISLGKLINLEELYLSRNLLSGVVSEVHFTNLSKLKELHLNLNSLSMKIMPGWAPPFQLEDIDLDGCDVGPQFPDWIRTQRRLKSLWMKDSGITSSIPIWFKDLPHGFNSLDLSHNQIHGKVRNLPLSILDLDLSFNKLEGPLPDFPLGIKSLDLSNNNINGSIPVSISGLKNLTTLSLSKNHLSGKLPQFGNFSQLSKVDFSFNFITGSIPHSVCGLGDINLSDNYLTGKIPFCSNATSSLSLVDFSSNHLTGSIPHWFCNIEDLAYLDLSRNLLSGKIPRCWKDSGSVMVIDFSFNHLVGSLPGSLCQLPLLLALYLSHNFFHGVIPTDFHKCKRLEKLDLGENNFLGDVPSWIAEEVIDYGAYLTNLRILRLRSNNFTGDIPTNICNLQYLQILDVADNHLSGTIPSCIGNLKAMVYNHTDWGSDFYPFSDVLTETIKGREQEYMSIMKFLVNLDLSSNDLVGQIPKELTKLSGLIGLNLSRNHLTGTIPSDISNMSSLISLDFSSNKFSGTIPQNIISLTLISHLNLSFNNLSGRIPSGHQLQTFNSSIFEGNDELCGLPLTKKCFVDQLPHAPTFADDKRHQEDHSNLKFFYILGALPGFVVGFWGACGILLLKKTWRYAYFRFLDDIQDRLLVAVSVRIIRLKRKLKKHN